MKGRSSTTGPFFFFCRMRTSFVSLCHPDRSEQRKRSGRISDSFATAKPVPVLSRDAPRVDIYSGAALLPELLERGARELVVGFAEFFIDPARRLEAEALVQRCRVGIGAEAG